MKKKIKLLFVDDEERFLESTARRLTLRDLEVFSFTNGADALAAAEDNIFDVALLDLKMPGMDGEELLKKLKEHDPSMEVVILTGHGSLRSAVDCTRSGAYGYLQKPCELDAVISAITEAYGNRVKARKAAKAAKVEKLMSKAVGYSPMELLEEIRKIDQED